MHDEIVEGLVGRYRTLADAPPGWAYPLSPSVPFVGTKYLESPNRLAVYASAENLSHYERKETPIPDYHLDERVWNRHRAARESSGNRFFPFVHIAPVEKGGLLIAALFVKKLLGDTLDVASPSELLETLVVANVGKFSIRTDGESNRDYAGSMRYLQDSLRLFQADLVSLRPDTLIIPKTIYRHSRVQRVVQSAIPDVVVIPVPQFNPQVLNIHLKPRQARATGLREELCGSSIAEWVARLKGFKDEYVYRYLAELEHIVSGLAGSPCGGPAT